ncbi:hypothetical protein A2641_01220 [Candidatus Nomurabacteria bacterium RIFCSPHIGHO2_01_FULL_37_25]|uniref:Uncharacterized protein n=1 Tax=Candidatus Nomurabacteria bacterium RIFCSPLOWO2_01_FULL_36_16 TaxID=1801767 RepID=A0A1F6WYX6_9BACT|nr:MAG: hypothetical protein A2641_01220 [Candidatus Nomurabacteria bacterium RIFCSPHIGHO2_01_FULL_37_25]OGI75335.1 MAG: hypothetical protein A3D36_02120 [Candidatus Nomurabacteria bacterium RIFCSPHIGHO2_02_FULL_36_29]OGI87082.1 MAG: hypothetical protein A3A91_00215 [Candidatus Nomurabacteria bacterium RIFCSPLOWO2_01_FULL_36_16]
MKKNFLIPIIILINLTGLLVLAVFKSPDLLSSLFVYYAHRLSGSELVGINWYFLAQWYYIRLTFFVSTTVSVLIFLNASRRISITPPISSLFVAVFLFVAVIGSFFIPALCSEGGCVDLGGIFMLIFYAAFQISLAFLIAKSMQTNVGFFMNATLLIVSLLLFTFSFYTTTNCGYSASTQDNCHAMIAYQFIQMDECNKILDSSAKQSCINHVNDRTELMNKSIAWKDHPLETINNRINECQTLPWERRITSAFHGGIMDGCYESITSDIGSYLGTPHYIPCTTKSLRPQEENDFLQCLRVFGKKDFMNETNGEDLYRRTCQELKGAQKENCLRIAM